MAAAASCSTTSPTSRRSARSAAAHAPFGTTALLPTLITDTPADHRGGACGRRRGGAAGKVPGFLGLHLEGPHLSVARKGAHDPALIRPMTDADAGGADRGAPKLAGPADHRRAGIGRRRAHRSARRGRRRRQPRPFRRQPDGRDAPRPMPAPRMVTHLFNAMSQIGNREPGWPARRSTTAACRAGLIADGIHVDPATIGIALRAKRGPGHDLPGHRRHGDDRHRHDLIHAQRPHHLPQATAACGWRTERWPAPIST